VDKPEDEREMTFQVVILDEELKKPVQERMFKLEELGKIHDEATTEAAIEMFSTREFERLYQQMRPKIWKRLKKRLFRLHTGVFTNT